MADIQYYRILKTKDGAVFGDITVKGSSFVGVENRKQGFDSVPAGLYTLRLDEKPTGKVPCLRFIEVPGRKGGAARPFLIHRAFNDNWTTLAGCIAPGMSVAGRNGVPDKIEQSSEAMGKMLELLGLQMGDLITISIANNAPGDSWTRDEFIARRKKGRPT